MAVRIVEAVAVLGGLEAERQGESDGGDETASAGARGGEAAVTSGERGSSVAIAGVSEGVVGQELGAERQRHSGCDGDGARDSAVDVSGRGGVVEHRPVQRRSEGGGATRSEARDPGAGPEVDLGGIEDEATAVEEAASVEETVPVVTLAKFRDWCVRNPKLAKQLSPKHLRGVQSCEAHSLLEPESNLLAASSFQCVSKSERHKRSHGEETAALNKLREIHGLQRCYRGANSWRRGASRKKMLWVQCDACSKWRRLGVVTAHDPLITQPSLSWVCSMNQDERYNSCEDAEEPWGTPNPKLELRVGAYVRMPGSRFVTAADTSWFVGKVAGLRQRFWVVVYNDGDVEEFDQGDQEQCDDLRQFLVTAEELSAAQKALLDAQVLEATEDKLENAEQLEGRDTRKRQQPAAAARENKRKTPGLRPTEDKLGNAEQLEERETQQPAAAARENKRKAPRLRPTEDKLGNAEQLKGRETRKTQQPAAAARENKRKAPRLRSVELVKSAALGKDKRLSVVKKSERVDSASPRKSKRHFPAVHPAGHSRATKRKTALAPTRPTHYERSATNGNGGTRSTSRSGRRTRSSGHKPLDEQLQLRECYLLQADVADGQEKHPIPVYGPRPDHPTPADGPTGFRYTASSEWCTSQPPDWPLVPARHRGSCPCWRWAPSTFLTAELCMEGAHRPPTVHAMKEQLLQALSRNGDECDICVDVFTHSQSHGVSNDSQGSMRNGRPRHLRSRSRQPSERGTRLSGSRACSYPSYGTRMPCSSLVGEYINQQFDVAGSSPRWFRGQVVEYSAATETYLVRYEDGEQQHLTHAEVIECLEEPDEAVESRWLRVPPASKQAAYRSCHTLRQISVVTGCDYNALRELNARYFSDLALRGRTSEHCQFRPETLIQLPHEPQHTGKPHKNARRENGVHSSLQVEYVYIRSVHIECGIAFEDAKTALRSLPGYTVLECVDKTATFELKGDAPESQSAGSMASGKSTNDESAVQMMEKTKRNDVENEGNDKESWDVEKIVSKGRSDADGTLLYRVRWLGYPPSSDTWQTVEDLEGAGDAIAAYERKTRQAPLSIVPADEYSSDLLERGPIVRPEEVDLLSVGTKLWLQWADDTKEYHQGEITRLSATPGWYDIQFESIVLEGGGRTRCFHLSRCIAEKKVCWTYSEPSGRGEEDGGSTHASAPKSQGRKQIRLRQHGYYDSLQRLRFWTQLPVRECSVGCGCSRNCANRVLQKGIHVRGLTVQWMGKKGWGVVAVEPLAAGTFVCEYAGQIKKSNASEDVSNRFTLGLPGGQHVIDAQSAGNLGRFVNHACDSIANCLYQAVIIDGNPSERVGVFTNQPVRAKTELTVNYGSSFCQPEKTAETPSRCLCSSDCTNWIATI